MIPEISNLSYNQRIKDLDLITILQRSQRGYLIEVFKLIIPEWIHHCQCNRAFRI